MRGGRLTGSIARELAADGFHPVVAADASAVEDHRFDAILLEVDHVEPRRVIEDVRRYCPAHIVLVVTIGAVMIVHAFATVPRAEDLERLRMLAAAVRRATA